MKKLFVILFLFISMSVYAFNYPVLFIDLLDKYKEEKIELIVITSNNHQYSGLIKLVQQDYILFEGSFGTVCIQTSAIVEISEK